jgi:hypothetical protein
MAARSPFSHSPFSRLLGKTWPHTTRTSSPLNSLHLFEACNNVRTLTTIRPHCSILSAFGTCHRYVYDSAWHAEAQDLGAWFDEYSVRRYGGIANEDAKAAWELLLVNVYHSQAGGWHDDTGVEWKATETPPVASGINTSQVCVFQRFIEWFIARVLHFTIDCILLVHHISLSVCCSCTEPPYWKLLVWSLPANAVDPH